MMTLQQWEGVVEERLRDWDTEMQNRQLLAQLPTTPPRWRHWLGRTMVVMGTWLLQLGERVARRECPECVSVAS